MDYNTKLKEQFGDLVINLVRHDSGSAPGCLPAYIEVHLGKKPKDMGQTALDLSNYIYRTTGLSYRSCPEYRGRGKSTTIRWFMDKADFEKIRLNVLKAFGKESMIKVEGYIPFEFNSLIIQDSSRGVRPNSEVA